MCVCSGCSWGWMADDPVSDFDWLIKMLVDVICRDGNLLLNVGPDKNGKLSEEVQTRMREIGAWLKENAEAVYGTRGGPVEPVDNVYGTTSKGNKIYVHVLDRKAFAKEQIPLQEYQVEHAALLHGAALPFKQDKEGIQIDVSSIPGTEVDTIVVLTLKEEVKAADVQEIYFTGKV